MKLSLYRFLTTAGSPLIRFYLSRRLRRGKEDPARFDERLGHASVPRPNGLVVWLHGASVGEALSMMPVIDWLRDARPDICVLVTTGTVTSAKLLEGRLPEGVIHQYVPVDCPAWVCRFLDHWRPDHALMFESELWPNMLLETSGRGIEMTLVNGRMSGASFEKWSRHPGVARRLLGCFGLCLGQTKADTERFLALGVQKAETTGNLKLAAAPLPADETSVETFAGALQGRPNWLASSTHAGEEALAGRVHRTLQVRVPNLLTMIVPRHPHRGAAIERELRQAGFRVSRRGDGGAMPSQSTEIYIADTLGELGLFYRVADLVFTGKSLVSSGGQNPIEPAHFAKPVLFGPNMQNFAELSDRMQRADAAIEVPDEAALAATIEQLLIDASERERRGQAALAFASGEASVLESITAAISARLPARQSMEAAS